MIEDDIRRGRRAEALLRDALVLEIFDDIRADLTQKWETEMSPEKRETIWQELHGLKLFRRKLEAMVENGKFSEQLAKP